VQKLPAAQIGLEDFALQLDADDANTICVDGWQCKSPAAGTKMTAGTSALAAVIAAKTLPPALDPIKYLSHASVKACWGMSALLAILSHAAGTADVTFRPRTVYLRTTAVLDNAARELALSPMTLDSRSDRSIQRERQERSAGLQVPDWSSSRHGIFWSVEDGVEWTDTLLPAECRGSLTTPELIQRTVLLRNANTAQLATGHGASGALGSR